MKNFCKLTLTFLIFIVGCAKVQYSPVQQEKIKLEHKYELFIIDLDGNPLDGVKIDYELRWESYHWKNWKISEKVVETHSNITTSNGRLFTSYLTTRDPRYPFLCKSVFSYKASKNGYYSKNGELSRTDTITDGTLAMKDTINLIKPEDYLNREFASSIADFQLKAKILNFIDLIILRGIVNASFLELYSINLSPFKGNSYLQFKFNNTNIYNSSKLNNYDIGKRIFDDLIRKLLSPLNEHISDSNLFYGYDINLVTHTKSFIEDYESASPIEYRFFIPIEIVSKYKNKDITGQQVLDSSIILMDDERIELKLQ